jgi:hypothetical protein
MALAARVLSPTVVFQQEHAFAAEGHAVTHEYPGAVVLGARDAIGDLSAIAMFHQSTQADAYDNRLRPERGVIFSPVPVLRCSMKRHWVMVAITFMALIGVGIVVRSVRGHRQLAKWAAVYRIRAERGDAKSQWALGAMYYYGKGVPKDYIEAVRWYRKSAEQGDATGEYSLSHMYHEGKGLPQDDVEFVLLFVNQDAQPFQASVADMVNRLDFFPSPGCPRGHLKLHPELHRSLRFCRQSFTRFAIP